MKIVIAGAGEVGSHLAKMLGGGMHEVTVIDSDLERLQALSSNADIIAVEGSPTSIDILETSGIGYSDLFIAVMPASTQDVNIVAALLAKKMGCKKVTARINDVEYLTNDNNSIFNDMGIDLLFYPEKIAADEICNLMGRIATTDSGVFANGKLQMGVFRLEDHSPVIGMTLQEFAENTQDLHSVFRVTAVSRNDETIIPKYDTRLKYNDLLYVLSTPEGIENLMPRIGKNTLEAIRSAMIMGGGHIGEMVALSLAEKGIAVKIIDVDKARCNHLAEKLPESVMIINGDGRDTNFLMDEDIRNYDAFIALTPRAETNILACVAAKKLGIGRTIAHVENIEYISMAEGMGVDAVINKKLITASKIFKYTLSDKVRSIKYMNGTDAQIIEYIVTPDSKITEAPLMELDFPEGAIIGGVVRGNESFIAVGSTHIEVMDRVIVFAKPDAVKKVEKWFR